MRVDFGAGGARHVGDQVGEVGGGLELDFAVGGGSGAGPGEGICFEDRGGCHFLCVWVGVSFTLIVACKQESKQRREIGVGKCAQRVRPE